jgi:hypothetical protein
MELPDNRVAARKILKKIIFIIACITTSSEA